VVSRNVVGKFPRNWTYLGWRVAAKPSTKGHGFHFSTIMDAIKIVLEVWAAMRQEQILETSADIAIDIAEPCKPIQARLPFRTAITAGWVNIF
jgi:hypothetical protein